MCKGLPLNSLRTVAMSHIGQQRSGECKCSEYLHGENLALKGVNSVGVGGLLRTSCVRYKELSDVQLPTTDM